MVYVEHVLGPSCAYVGPRSAYVRPMLAKVGPRLASVRLMSANVGPMLSNLGGYVGHMLAIFEPMLGKCEATYVPHTHDMSIKPVRAARITDTTGALLGDGRRRRRPQNTVKRRCF